MNFKRLIDSTNVATAQPFGVVDVCVLVKQGCVGWNHKMYIFLIFAKVIDTKASAPCDFIRKRKSQDSTNGTHCCLLMAHISRRQNGLVAMGACPGRHTLSTGSSNFSNALSDRLMPFVTFPSELLGISRVFTNLEKF